MGTSSFQRGAVIQLDCRQATLLRKISESDWQIEDDLTKRIFEYSDEQLRSFYVAGQLRFAGDLAQPFATKKKHLLNVPADALEIAKIRRLYVQSVIDLPNTPTAFEPAIKKTWEELRKPQTQPHFTTVFRWKKRYLNAGSDILSLTDNAENKGNRRARYPDEVIELVEKAIDAKYLQLERNTIQETLDYAHSLVAAENRLRPESLLLPVPSRRLVTTKIEAIPEFDRCVARYGRTVALKRFRAVHNLQTTDAPLRRAEIDHTQLDLMVIDDDSGLPLGRPFVTICIDDYTRCVLGLYISFEPPSFFTVSKCLMHAFLPKTDMQKRFPSIKNQWQAHGVMRELVVDNGPEFHSASFDNACYSLGIEIHYSARKTPWFKGKIERFAGTFNRAVAHGTPGTTFSNIFEKEEYNSKKHAIVRFKTFKEVAYTWVADVYHQRKHRALNISPSVMWAGSVNPEDIEVPDDPFDLGFILGRSEKRILSHKGIELHGLNYNSPELTALRRKLGEKLSVEIRIDTSDIGHIAVLSPDRSSVFRVPALQFGYANGLSEWQHRVCKRFAAQQMDSYTPDDWLEAKDRIRQLIENELLYKKQGTKTKIARYKNMDATPEPASPPVPTEHEQRQDLLPHAVKEQVDLETQESFLSDEITNEMPAASSHRYVPLFRERTLAALNAEQSDHLDLNHE